jgi:transposase
VEALRLLRIARRSANQARTQVANQLRSVPDTAPVALRYELACLSFTTLMRRCAAVRPGADLAEPINAAKHTLRSLARRFRALDTERAELDERIGTVVRVAAPPALLAEFCVGPLTATDLLVAADDNRQRFTREQSFAAVCGASPIDASSGKQQRHRLNRGGDRQANHALWRIIMVRLAHDPTTRTYLQRRTAEGKTKREAIRCLKRYLARRIWRILNEHQRTRPALAP